MKIKCERKGCHRPKAMLNTPECIVASRALCWHCRCEFYVFDKRDSMRGLPDRAWAKLNPVASI